MKRTHNDSLVALDEADQFWKYDPGDRAWNKLEIPVVDTGELKDFEINSRGDVFLLYYLSSADACVLKSYDGNRWRSSLVRDFSSESDEKDFLDVSVMLKVDQKQNPVVCSIIRTKNRHIANMYRITRIRGCNKTYGASNMPEAWKRCGRFCYTL